VSFIFKRRILYLLVLAKVMKYKRHKNIFIRRIRKSLKKNTIICISDNPNKSLYPDMTLSLNEIDSIWHFEMLLSVDLPTSLTVTNNIETLQNDISDIKNTLRKFLNSKK